jgi:hypothetical protein
VLSCVDTGSATRQSPVQGILPFVYKITNLILNTNSPASPTGQGIMMMIIIIIIIIIIIVKSKIKSKTISVTDRGGP